MILLGVNQTILFALSMVVIAGLIGGGGLGAVVTSGLYSNPALAILAGLAIVVMAMALDRSFEAIADRTDPARRHLYQARKRTQDSRARRDDSWPASVSRKPSASVPRTRTRPATRRARDDRGWLLAQIQVVLDYVQDPTRGSSRITSGRRTSSLQQLLLPLQEFLVEAPWFTTSPG
jgi:hypothetical protein